MNINIEINPKYIKPESMLLNIIIDDIIKNKKLNYAFSELNIPELKGSKIFFIERFIKKGIHYILKDETGIIMPIADYSILKNNISFNVTETFKNALLEENRFKDLDLKYVLKFEENFTKYFYYNFIMNTEKEKNLIIPMEELRNLLNLKEYERFYDFEINILKKLKKDIELRSNYLLEYNKIKSGEFKNNKVTAIEFSIYNKISKEKNEKVNELMGIIAADIKDFKYVYEILYKALNYVSFEELKTSLKLILKNISANSSIDEELNIFINNKYKLKTYKKIYEFNDNCKNPLKLQNFIYKKLTGITELKLFKDGITSTEFLKKLYFAKDGEQLFFEGDDIIISIKYSKKRDSLIEIFQKSSK